MTIIKPEIDSLTVKSVFASTPTGVVAVCADVAGKPEGFVVSSFVGISVEPPLVGFFVQRGSTTWPSLVEAPSLGLSLLGTPHARSLGQLSSKGVDRFANVAFETLSTGAVVLDDATVCMEATLFSEVPVGDHRLVVLRVREVVGESDNDPLVYLRRAVRSLHAGPGRA